MTRTSTLFISHRLVRGESMCEGEAICIKVHTHRIRDFSEKEGFPSLENFKMEIRQSGAFGPCEEPLRLLYHDENRNLIMISSDDALKDALINPPGWESLMVRLQTLTHCIDGAIVRRDERAQLTASKSFREQEIQHLRAKLDKVTRRNEEYEAKTEKIIAAMTSMMDSMGCQLSAQSQVNRSTLLVPKDAMCCGTHFNTDPAVPRVCLGPRRGTAVYWILSGMVAGCYCAIIKYVGTSFKKCRSDLVLIDVVQMADLSGDPHYWSEEMKAEGQRCFRRLHRYRLLIFDQSGFDRTRTSLLS